MKKANNGLPFILGITDQETVKLDFDKTPFRTVKYWAMRTMKWFKLKGFIILKSSKNSYHVVFDKKVSAWKDNVKIMAWVCLLSKHKKLTGWFILQCIKEGSTLRVSEKKEKPQPRIVYRYGSQQNQIAEFLAYRKIVKSIIAKLQRQKELCSPTIKTLT
jgi:abortive infection bacteriophage resistance protein